MCNVKVVGCGSCGCSCSWALDAESARGSGHRRFFKMPTERKKTEASDQRSDRSEQREVDVSFLPSLGVESVDCIYIRCWVKSNPDCLGVGLSPILIADALVFGMYILFRSVVCTTQLARSEWI